MRRAVAASNGGQTGEKHKEAGSIIKKESKEGDEFQDWQLDSNYDSNTLTSTRDLEAFMATLGGPVPLANMPEQLWPHAKQIEADIADYLKGYNKDVQAKCILAQELLRPGIERSPHLTDEMYLQLLKHLQGSNKDTSVRGWELLLLAACTSRPSPRFVEPISNYVHSASHATQQWPTTVSILAKRTWTALKQKSKPGRRVNVPSVGEIASVLTSKSMKVQVTFVDGSNKWLFYDWTTTVASAVEQLAGQIGLVNYKDYTLFEARKVPKKLDADGAGSIATLPPDSYLLLDDGWRIADVLHDYEVRGAQNKLLLKRRRFDGNDADFSKPQFIALTEAHQAAMDEKVAEVANLTLRLREMSGKVMWFEALQEEKAAQLRSLEEQVAAAEARVKEVQLKGVPIKTADVIRERDSLAARVKQLEKSGASGGSAVTQQKEEILSSGDWRPAGLVRKLAQKTEEIRRLQTELDTLRSMVAPADVEKAASLAAEAAAVGARVSSSSIELTKDIEADMSEKEALYDLLRLQSTMEDEHTAEVAARDEEIEHLKQLIEGLARRQTSKHEAGRTSTDEDTYASPDSGDAGDREGPHSDTSHKGSRDQKEQIEIATAACMAMEGKLRTLQAALDDETSARADLQAEFISIKARQQAKEDSIRKQEKEWRGQVYAVKAESATSRSRLKAREAALDQASAEVEELHKEVCRLRTELDTKEWEVDCANANVASAIEERNAAQALVKQLKLASASSIGGTAATGDVSRRLGKREQEVSILTERLLNVVAERDAAVEKLSGIQQLMFGLSQGGGAATNGNGSSQAGPERRGKAKAVNDSCPLEIGNDPRRESIGGASAPPHLQGLAPLRVLPEEKRAAQARHPLFAANYVSPLVASTPDRRETKVVNREAAAMLDAANARRRLYQPGSKTKEKNERPAPTVQTTPRMTERINSGTHLLGLLSNANILRSHDSLPDANDLMQSVGSDAFRAGEDLLRTTSAASHTEHNRSLTTSGDVLPRIPSGGISATEGKSILGSSGATSTQSEPELHKAYEAALRAED